MGCVPFNVPPRNRKIAGDFHRPYENSECFTAQKLPVSTRKRYRVGQGTHV